MDDVKEQLSTEMDEKLAQISFASANVEDGWEHFKEILLTVASNTLGSQTKKHQDWFDENDEEIQVILKKKHTLHVAWINDASSPSKKAAYLCIKSKLQSKLRQMCDAWWSARAAETQEYAERKDSKKFYDSLKCVYGPQSNGSCT